MVISPNILPPSEAKPYFTRNHLLNTVGDSDDMIDWTSYNRNQKQVPKGLQEAADYQTLTERSETSDGPEAVSKNYREFSGTGGTALNEKRETASERMSTSEMPTSEEPKEVMKRSDLEDPNYVINENEYHGEDLGEGISSLYNKVKDSVKDKVMKKKSNTGLEEGEEEDDPFNLRDDYKSEERFYRQNNPVCFRDERTANGYSDFEADPEEHSFVMDAAPPAYFLGSPESNSRLYKVGWLQEDPESSGLYRRRRETDYQFSNPEEAYSHVANRDCDTNEKILQAKKELMSMIRELKDDFLNKNNLTFIPILFVPNCESCKLPCPCIPLCRKCDHEPRCCPQEGINIGKMTIILLVNNSLSIVLPGMCQEIPIACQKEVPIICLQEPPHCSPCPQPCCVPCPYKRNVITNLKQCLDNAFNFIDFRKVLTDDELHRRDSRSIHCCGEIIPGILLYPKCYSCNLPNCKRVVKDVSTEKTEKLETSCSATTETECTSKFRRSVETDKNTITEADIVAEEAELEIDNKKPQLEMPKDLNLEEVRKSTAAINTPKSI